MKRIGTLLSDYLAPLVCLLGVLIILALYVRKQPLILSPFGITSLANAAVALALAAAGQTIVLLTAGLDLSIGAEISLVNCFAATAMADSVPNIAVVVTGSLLIGVVAGAINGWLVAYARIEPLITTFCTFFIYSGLALVIRPQPGGFVPSSFASLLTGYQGYVPDAVVLLLGFLLVVWLPTFRSRLGRKISAVGDSEDSAFATGINVKAVKLWAYVLSGVFAAGAGLFLTAETTSGDATIGNIYTLNSLAAAVLGGVALTGGRGTIFGAILGSLILSMILNVLGVWGISAFWQNFIEGWILILVLSIAGLRIVRAGDWLTILKG